MKEGPKKQLLDIVRSSIEQYIQSGQIYEPSIGDPELLVDRGVFVTLKLHGSLRGCVGRIEPPGQPLWETVRDMAIAAAFRDHRFEPVSLNELNGLEYEISILSKPVRIGDYRKVELGKHGVIVEKDGCGGVFLPQVALETGWSLERFMAELCSQKAGLAGEAYKNDPDLKISVFTVEKID